MRILLVDDEILREVLSQALKAGGHRPTTAADGREALPELVVCDVQMPRMDGIELLQEVRSRYPVVPVVIMTGGNGRASGPAFQHGATGYLQKPIRIDEFMAGIQRFEAGGG